ncbi:MAG TPA: quinone oxidoreductase, partial [Alphaproteobacteria bacterium]|nr:quinone oxidoreductase [Alphaproteobacteria bacterium]
QISRTGGPEVMELVEKPLGAPGSGEVLVRHDAIGLNFVETYYRSGLYKAPLPTGLGSEAAGVIEAVGPDVTDLKPGDRVAYATGPLGAYAEARVMPTKTLVKLPDGIETRQAAAMMLQGMTACYLLTRTYKVKPGDTILLHAAAGGVGLIASQWAKHLGARVIGTVGSEEKAALAHAHGCDEIILYREEDIVPRVKELTGGKGVTVVYDSVGKDTFDASLDSLKPLGMLVSFGNASGPPPPFDPLLLGTKGSLFLTRPSLFHYCADRADLEAIAKALFDVVGSGAVKIEVKQTYPLEDVATAHADLEARRTTGSTILQP